MRCVPRPEFIKRLGWVGLCLFLLVSPVYGQSDSEINLNGAFDFHVHQAPDSSNRVIDADDLARLAKESGMRGMIMKNHFEDTAALVYMVRKEVPGIELYGGITQDLAVGGINLEAVKHMAAMKGGYGRIVWLPTFDAENAAKVAKESRTICFRVKGRQAPPWCAGIDRLDCAASKHRAGDWTRLSRKKCSSLFTRRISAECSTSSLRTRWRIPL